MSLHCVQLYYVIALNTDMLRVIVSYSDSQHTITDYCYAECHVLCGYAGCRDAECCCAQYYLPQTCVGMKKRTSLLGKAVSHATKIVGRIGHRLLYV